MKRYCMGVQHIGLPTNDLDKTIAFYLALGFEIALQTVNEQAGERVAFLRLGNLTVECYENRCAVGHSGAWDHLALDVTDVEAVFRMMQEKGFTAPGQQIEFLPFWEKGVRFFTIIGPNGEKVEFSQYL